jgi:hypothetical protein
MQRLPYYANNDNVAMAVHVAKQHGQTLPWLGATKNSAEDGVDKRVHKIEIAAWEWKRCTG